MIRDPGEAPVSPVRRWFAVRARRLRYDRLTIMGVMVYAVICVGGLRVADWAADLAGLTGPVGRSLAYAILAILIALLLLALPDRLFRTRDERGGSTPTDKTR